MNRRNELEERATQLMLNSIPKEHLVNMFAKGATHFSFRGGPVEDMHSNGKLTDEDMKVLNKYMVDKLGMLFTLILDNKNIDALKLILPDFMLCRHWDDADVSMLEEELRLSGSSIMELAEMFIGK